MKFDFIKNTKVLCFLGGAAAAICAGKASKSKKVHDICVSGVAKGMQLFDEAKAAAVNIKEEAEDICREAKDSIEKEEE